MKCIHVLLFIILSSLSKNVLANQQLQLTKEERAWLKEHPIIRVAADPDYPPVESFDVNHKLTGIAADYLSYIEEILGIRFYFLPTKSWDEAIDLVKQKKADMFSAATRSEQRDAYATFTRPHIELPGVIIMRANQQRIGGMADLNHRKVAVVSGYIWQEWINRDFPEVNLIPVADMKEGLEKVSFGEIDAMVANLATASEIIHRRAITNLRVAGDSGYWARLAMASRKDWPELAIILDKAIASISQQQKREIYDKWISPGLLRKNDFTFWQYVSGVIILFALVVIAMITRWRARQRGAPGNAIKPLETEQRFRRFYEMTNECLFVVSYGVIEDVNPAVSRMLGYKTSALTGKAFIEFITNDKKADVIQRMASEDSGPYESTMLHATGQHVTVSIQMKDLQVAGKKASVFGVYNIRVSGSPDCGAQNIEKTITAL